ncbi:MAG TPA: maleylacetate reductase [Mycobacteriales bacterium]|nr:maleylacetate reductase [Mycobacteriales bacterium]
MSTAAEFVYEALPMRVVVGPGTVRRVRGELDRLGVTRALVLCTPGQRPVGQAVADLLGEVSAGLLAEARMHVPVAVAERARDVAREVGATGCVAVGGGSAIGLGKAVALDLGLPVVAIPTTYAGSEMTPVWGLTDDTGKHTGRDQRVLPSSVIYDPELTLSLPAATSVTSGFNAVAHAVEALYAPDVTPIISLMAGEGTRAVVAALPDIAADPTDLDARSAAQYGAWLCGACLAATTMSLHHKLCHALGGTLDLPHAPTHTVVLPHVLAYNQASAPAARRALGTALDTDDPALTLWQLAGDLGAPRSLHELGMAASDIDVIAAQATDNPYANPRPVTREDVAALLRDAWSGARPGSSIA